MSKHHGWVAPLQECGKINVEASYNTRERLVGLGIVTWDSDEHVCFSAIVKIDHVHTPFHAEIRATALGMELAMDLGFPRLILASNSLMAML